MKQTVKYLNDNRKKCLLGVNNFLDGNCRIVGPCEIATIELDIADDDVIFIKTWKTDDRILISTTKKAVWDQV